MLNVMAIRDQRHVFTLVTDFPKMNISGPTGFLHTLMILSGLRFVQEIKIISKYRDCLKVLRIVICKY